MEIEDINPWWTTSKIQEEFIGLHKRELFNEIAPYIKNKQIIAITGLRRVGKTVIMHHVIEYLLKQVPKENILYYNFDLFDKKIEKILDSFKQKVKTDIKKEKVFVFLDEIQKHKEWENELKVLYDNFPNMKFFISGSSSLFIEKKTKESLAGRVFSFVLKPLTFKEYLKLRKIEFDKKRILLYRSKIEKYLEHYLKTGGFPELINEDSEVKISKYMKELVIDKVIFIDIPNVFKIDEPALLSNILSVISSNPGMILDYESLANDLNRNRKTISNYILYLEKAFLIKKLYNYSRNTLTSEKKLKRFYPISTAFSFLFNAEKGKIIENSILMNYEIKFFSRIGEKEVDFIITEKNKTIPIEVKYKDNIKEKEIKGLLKFMEKHSINEGAVITKENESEKSINKKKIKFIPLWKFLLN